MKKVMIILSLIFFAGSASGQRPKTIRVTNNIIPFKRDTTKMYIKSVSVLEMADTIQVGSIVFYKPDTLLYLWNGKNWIPIKNNNND